MSETEAGKVLHREGSRIVSGTKESEVFIVDETNSYEMFQAGVVCRDDPRRREIRATMPDYDLACFCPLTPAQDRQIARAIRERESHRE